MSLRCLIFGHRWSPLFDEPGEYCWRCGAVRGTAAASPSAAGQDPE